MANVGPVLFGETAALGLRRQEKDKINNKLESQSGHFLRHFNPKVQSC